MAKQRPDDASILVREGNGCDIRVASRGQTREPSIRFLAAAGVLAWDEAEPNG